ncbi:hypothetical protein N7507_011259 [Penicillium longicatenatum]|nr:hypothetical protein N7507_011259 [Penicillium longicatenatum]
MSGNLFARRDIWDYAGYELRPNRQDLDPNLPEQIICSRCLFELPQQCFSATQLAHLNDALDIQGTKVLHGEGDFQAKCYKCIDDSKRIEYRCRFCNEWKPVWWFARSQHTRAFQQSHSQPVCMPCQDKNFENIGLSQLRLSPAPETEQMPGIGLSSRTEIRSPNLILDWDEEEGFASSSKSPPSLILDWDEKEGRLSMGDSPDSFMDWEEDKDPFRKGKEIVRRQEPLSREEIEDALRASRETEEFL